MTVRALILEDDSSWQQILKEILADGGLIVDIVDNLSDALTIISQQVHRLAVVDLSLDEADPHNQDGLILIDALKKHDPGCNVILLTGYATVEIAVQVLTDYGVLTCLKKENFQREAFKSLVSQALSVPDQRERVKREFEMETGKIDVEDLESVVLEPKRALLVEDDAGWREILDEILTESGYMTRACTSYGEALGWMRRESYHLAVIDLSLDGVVPLIKPGQDSTEKDLEGFRLLDSMDSARMPVIVVSGAATMDEIEKAYREFDIFAFIEKQTFDRRVFRETLTEATVSRANLSLLETLTNREREVLELLSKGLTNKEIAKALVITPNTVKRHLKAIFEKFNIHTRSAAASMAAGWFGSIRDEKQPTSED